MKMPTEQTAKEETARTTSESRTVELELQETEDAIKQEMQMYGVLLRVQ
jgi:hypothetical protein